MPADPRDSWPRDTAGPLARAASEFAAQKDLAGTASAILNSALALFEDASEGSVAVRSCGRYRTLARSQAFVARLDAVQSELLDGPYVSWPQRAELCRSGDVGDDARWPSWGRVAKGLGVGSLLSIRLVGDDAPLAALSLYSQRLDAFERQVDLVPLFAVHASTAFANAQQIENLKHALVTRHDVGVAVGILMGKYDWGEIAAWAALRTLSQRDDVKLRDAAQGVIATRTLPPDLIPDA